MAPQPSAQTPSFTGIQRGTYDNNGIYTPVQGAYSAIANGYLQSNDANATQITPGSAVTYYFTTTPGGTQSAVAGNYLGEYTNNGTQYPLFRAANDYYLLGQSNTGPGTTYQINAVTYGTVAPTPPTNPAPPINNAPCYCTGTRILTWRDHATAEVAVENLCIGDTVVTASGTHRPIRWIGTRSYLGRFANTNPAVLPVCVKTGALADSVPARDLWVSPDHALFLDGMLIPAELLVNGTTITKAERVESVTYWHIELDSHDVLLAEGAPAESFVDDGGRAIFHNAASHRALYPQTPPWSVPAVYCAPRVADDGRHGHTLEAIRRRLALRAGLAVATERVFGDLRGHLDLCAAQSDGGLRVAGWAQDLAHPNGPVCLDVVVDGAVVALTYAEDHRADLEAVGIGDGRHAFDLMLPAALDPAAPHTIVVRRSADGAVLGTARVPAVAVLAA